MANVCRFHWECWQVKNPHYTLGLSSLTCKAPMWLGLLVAEWFAPLIRNVLACCHYHQIDQDDR
jgi:hypothetical protein